MSDKFGRKPALITSIGLMASSTCGIGLIPDYDTIGGPVLLLLNLRILQGFSFGGEYPGSIIFLVEHAPRAKRGFYGCLTDAGANTGFLLASLVAWLLSLCVSDAATAQWAWRLPFLLGALIGLVGWFARRRVPETELFQETVRMPRHYLRLYQKYANQLKHVVLIITITLFITVLGYLVYVFSITYMSDILDYSRQQALSINIVSIILLVSLEPWMGKLSDRIGRRPVMALAMVGTVLWTGPYFWLLQQNNPVLALLAKCIMTPFISAYSGVSSVIMVEIVPVHLRFGVVAFAYAIAASIFGGATPWIATLLIKTTHSYYSLALYIVLCALVSAVAIYQVRETRYTPQ